MTVADRGCSRRWERSVDELDIPTRETKPSPAPTIIGDTKADDTPAVVTTVDTTTVGRDKHLYQLDLVRLITFGAVILDHVVMGAANPANAVAGGVELTVRYSRYGFFFLTGFVLGYQYRNRELKPIEFWRRRFKLIGIPYVTWTIFYWIYSRYRGGGFDALKDTVNSADHIVLSLKSLAYDLVTGNAWYHLYFLFVSMQIYLVFPLVLIILKKTWGYHRYLLAVSFAAHMALLYFMVRPQTGFIQEGPQGVIWRHLLITILPYQFFVLAGIVAALHFEKAHAFTVRWRKFIFSGGLIVLAATLVYFAHKVDVGEEMFRATNVFMPHNAFAYVATIAMLYGLGSMWRERRRPGSRADTFLRTAADRSFGIYLAHALALNELQPTINSHRADPTWLVALIGYLATVALTVFIVEVLRRSPISLMTTGRNMVSWKVQTPVRSIVVGVVAIALGVILRSGFGLLAGDLISITGALLIASAALVFWRQRSLVESSEPVESARV
ncbi:Peptidoglycan/LPS O-acetylase OafA/YrhL, contains acyltransferase and SGNH-hydrolase domains [Williamsia maris]|uniref:Peptidoglycan/LPS O-acetylase OafA/YrhL, contains acyltransferase and SGNH-hydrolase domains n=1 Tax=Williamsia maris TaxID=72806 RepID=A0ABT1HJP9_9NOCA|nr:Peptidoglycan/LPS O-acetylase OafA/YrhL, contains acyltransferase and SGNH-hydrolase domains [Williamsia maris]